MLVAVDPGLGREATHVADVLSTAFKEPVSAFVAPNEAPDDALAAALAVAPPVVIESPEAPSWLRELSAKRVAVTAPVDLELAIEATARAAALTLRPPPKGHAERAAPLDARGLKDGLAGLPDHWRLEVSPARTGPSGLKVELAADFRCPSYGEAAEFARLVAGIADGMDHHPTLVHDWRTVKVRVTTGAARSRLSERDLRFAAAVDEKFAG